MHDFAFSTIFFVFCTAADRPTSTRAEGYSGKRADWQQDIQSCEQTGSRIFNHASRLAAGYSDTQARCLQIFRHTSRLAAGYSGMGADWQQDIQAWEQTGSRIFRHGSRLAAGYSVMRADWQQDIQAREQTGSRIFRQTCSREVGRQQDVQADM